MNIPLEDYVSGGYLITRFIDAASVNQWMRHVCGASEDLLPPTILSVGFCEARFAPCFDWAGASHEDYAEFGIPANLIQQLNEWTNNLLDSEIGYPRIFLKLSTAREYIGRFLCGPRDIQLLGIGLHKDDHGRLEEVKKLNPSCIEPSGAKMAGFEGSGFAQAIRLGDKPVEGEILGFDVIACRYVIDHSWHCNGLAGDGVELFHFRPNRFGLIDERTNAVKLADFANERLVEDSIWLPVLVTRYPNQSQGLSSEL